MFRNSLISDCIVQNKLGLNLGVFLSLGGGVLGAIRRLKSNFFGLIFHEQKFGSILLFVEYKGMYSYFYTNKMYLFLFGSSLHHIHTYMLKI
jgi:hypothetical protein